MAWFRKKMWLDVEGGWAGWIDTPNSGADASPTGWGTEATFLNGGGYVDNSWGTHKRYTFEWSDASSRQAAQFMQSLRNGTYGKGLIHFIEPTLYDTNILPARVAAPHLSVEDEGRPLVPGVTPSVVNAQLWEDNLSPVQGLRWDFSLTTPGYPGPDSSIYVSIPEGYSLALGAGYNYTGSGGIYVRTNGAERRISATPGGSNQLLSTENIFSGARSARIWIGKTGPGAAQVTAFYLIGRLIPTNKIWGRHVAGYGETFYGNGPYGGQELTATWTNLARGPWVGGMGHSGVRFNGTPTLVHNTGVNGGQVGYAASFIETGAWN